jgi:thiol-disulfide isomerase/thioredoxin
MGDSGPSAPGRPGLGRGLKLAIAAALIVGVAGVLYVTLGSLSKPGDGKPALASIAKGGMDKLEVVQTPKPPPAASFVDASGKTVTLADFKGKVVVANLWATWCAPCKKEMPTLAKLAAEYQGQPVEVAAISVDSASATDQAKAFIASHKPLAFYQDAKLALPFAFDPPAQGFPTTILYDKKGMERARVIGEADWSSPEAKAVVDRLLSE